MTRPKSNFTLLNTTYRERSLAARLAISSAQYHVLAIPELVEIILSYLPVRDILFAQHWSKWHRDLVGLSKLLQHRLFFQPEKLPQPWPPSDLDDADIRPWRINELIFEKFPCFFITGAAADERRRKRSLTSAWGSKDGRKWEAFNRPEASWRRMLPVQPAISALEVYELSRNWDTARSERYPRRALIWSDDGLQRGRTSDDNPNVYEGLVTTGNLFDLLDGYLVPNRTFGLQWHMTTIPPPLEPLAQSLQAQLAHRMTPRYTVAPIDEDIPLPYATIFFTSAEKVAARSWDERVPDLSLSDILPVQHILTGRTPEDPWYSDINEY